MGWIEKPDPNLVFNSFSKFSIQPTIIRKDILLQIASNVGALNIWDFENAIVGSGMDFMARRGDEKRRGDYHYDSFVYPYVATAINKGKWNLIEYTEELNPIFEAQLQTYMKLLRAPKGIIINFNCSNIFKEGQKTIVNDYFKKLPLE